MHWGLQSADLQCGNLQSRATDFGFGGAVIALRPTVWNLQCGNLQFRATDFRSRGALIVLEPTVLGTYSVGTYNLGPPILDLWEHSLHWNLHFGTLYCGNLQSRATDFASLGALIALEPTVWGPTVLEPTISGPDVGFLKAIIALEATVWEPTR